jgi:hypothetical protein
MLEGSGKGRAWMLLRCRGVPRKCLEPDGLRLMGLRRLELVRVPFVRVPGKGRNLGLCLLGHYLLLGLGQPACSVRGISGIDERQLGSWTEIALFGNWMGTLSGEVDRGCCLLSAASYDVPSQSYLPSRFFV